MNQQNRKESGTANLQQFTSNPGPLPPTSLIWFQLSRGDLIIMPLIMVVLIFTLKSFHLNLTLNMFQIHIPLRLNQLMMMNWTVFWDSSTQNMTKIFWMLTSRCFRIDWWLPLLQNFIQYLLCCFINTEESILQS